MENSGIGGPVPPLQKGKLKKKVKNKIDESKSHILITPSAKPRQDSQNVSPSSVLAFPESPTTAPAQQPKLSTLRGYWNIRNPTVRESVKRVWEDEKFPASLGKQRRPFPKINFRIWGTINNILGDGMFEVRIRWLMYRKATYDKTEDNPPKAEPWVDEDGYTLHDEGWIKFYPRLTAIVSYKDIYSAKFGQSNTPLSMVFIISPPSVTFGATHTLVSGTSDSSADGDSVHRTENIGSFQKNITIKPSPVPASVVENSSCYRFNEIYQHGCDSGDPVSASRVAPVPGVAASVTPTSGVSASGEAPAASGVTAIGMTSVSGDTISGGTPISGVAASGMAPASDVAASVSGVAAPGVAPVPSEADSTVSGVAPVSGETDSDAAPVSGVIASGVALVADVDAFVSGAAVPGVTPVSCEAASGAAPVSGVVASGLASVSDVDAFASGAAAPGAAPVTCEAASDAAPVSGGVASGVTPVSGVAVFGAAPVSGVVAFGAAPAFGEASSGGTPFSGAVASGVVASCGAPVSGAVASGAAPVSSADAFGAAPVSSVPGGVTPASGVAPVSGAAASGVAPVSSEAASGAAAPGVAPVSGVVASGGTPVYSAAASGVAPVSGAVVPCVAPVTCAASGVAPSSGVAASDKDTAPMVISEVAVVAAPITPHEFVPGTNIDNSTRQISLSHGDLDAQTHDFGSPSKKINKPFPVHPSSSKEPSSQTFKRRARPNARRRRAVRRRQPDSLVDKACLGARVVSDMGQIPQDVLKKLNRPSARQRRRRRTARSPVEDMAVCAPDRLVICVVSLQKGLGLTAKDADFSAVWLTRDQFGMTFLDQVGLMDMSDLLELSKGLSKIGAKIFECFWFKLRTSKSPFSFLDKSVFGS